MFRNIQIISLLTVKLDTSYYIPQENFKWFVLFELDTRRSQLSFLYEYEVKLLKNFSCQIIYIIYVVISLQKLPITFYEVLIVYLCAFTQVIWFHFHLEI